MSQVRSEIPFMASLWIRSGCDMKVEPSVETYQVGAHFKALIKAILVAPSRILEIFFSFHFSLPRCGCLPMILLSLAGIGHPAFRAMCQSWPASLANEVSHTTGVDGR